jgi:GNAT superfamily N-acetyltransferase
VPVSNIDVQPVRSRVDRRAFLSFPWKVYSGDPLWVPPLLPQRAEAIDPHRGVFFARGEADFFVARRGGRVVGTIAVGEDPSANAQRPGWDDCIFGFFECLDDYCVAEALFDSASQWARSRGLNALLGPYNLDYEDSYGVLVDGRDRPAALFCGHSPPYYEALVTRYGFRAARADNIAFAIDLDLGTPSVQHLLGLADRIRRRGHILVRGADLGNWDKEIDRIHGLLNRSLAHLPGHVDWRRDVLDHMLQPFKQIVDPDLVLFAEIDGEPVGWLPGIPNLNEAFIHANGLRYPWDYGRLWWHMRRKPRCLAVKSVLVPPEYWGRGVAAVLFAEMGMRSAAKGYQWLDLSLTSEDNPNTPPLAEKFGATLYKRYRVYRLPL